MPYLLNTWYVAAHAEELARQPFGRTYLDTPVVLYRQSTGAVVAMEDRCPHRMAPLSRGVLVDDALQCPYHGLRFDAEGRCTVVPQGCAPPSRAKVRTFPLVERHSLIWIWMGDPERANAELIPDFSDREDPAVAWFTGVLHCKANYQLLVDNLLDLTHAEFLHPLLSSDGWAQRNRQQVTQDGDQVTILNVAEDDHILPITKRVKPTMGDIGRTVHTERWNPPSLVRLSVDYYSGDDCFLAPSAHLLTPETQQTTHYFIRGGQTLDPSNAEITRGFRASVLNVFETQDIPLIEAQQRNLGDRGLVEREAASLPFDRGALLVRRVLAARIEQEQTARSTAKT